MLVGFFIFIALLSWCYAIYILIEHKKFKKKYINKLCDEPSEYDLEINGKIFTIQKPVFDLIHDISKERDYWKTPFAEHNKK